MILLHYVSHIGRISMSILGTSIVNINITYRLSLFYNEIQLESQTLIQFKYYKILKNHAGLQSLGLIITNVANNKLLLKLLNSAHPVYGDAHLT